MLMQPGNTVREDWALLRLTSRSSVSGRSDPFPCSLTDISLSRDDVFRPNCLPVLSLPVSRSVKTPINHVLIIYLQKHWSTPWPLQSPRDVQNWISPLYPRVPHSYPLSGLRKRRGRQQFICYDW